MLSMINPSIVSVEAQVLSISKQVVVDCDQNYSNSGPVSKQSLGSKIDPSNFHGIDNNSDVITDFETANRVRKSRWDPMGRSGHTLAVEYNNIQVPKLILHN